jgi:acyl transferase domain-containing protein/acyl carrier protein
MSVDLREPLIEATKKLKALREQVDELQLRAREPIAIVGMACRLPGGIDSPDALWRLLDDARDAIEPFPADRYSTAELYSADPDAPGKTYCTRGGFVRDVARFDAAFFGIAPREAEAMDPAQRIALECAWEALEHAGIPPTSLASSPTGVYLGTVYSDYEPWGGSRGMSGMDGYGFTGRDGSVLSGRVAYTLGLRGPAITINTACSSSLVAMHLAVAALRSGDCKLAICGGSQVMSTPGCFVEFSRLRGLSSDGRCRSFGDAADGVGWGEGCSILVLQRLSEARRDGRRVLAVVRGTAVNQDGRSQGLTAPNGPAQERVVQRALADCGLTSDDIDAVEAHGTGTALGDPVEANALSAVFGPDRAGDRPLWIGSLKSNVGHTQAASGTAGVMKIVLALAHGKLPASLHADPPSSRIAWKTSGLAVLHEARAWSRGARVRRAGVNSFGISGTNAHVIVEEPPVDGEPARDARDVPVPVVLSAADAPALVAQAQRLADHLERHPETSALDVACSLATTRAHHAARCSIAIADRDPAALARSLRAIDERAANVVPNRPGKLVVLFTGQGSQRAQLGAQLHARFAGFRAALDAACAEIDRTLPRPLRDVMFAPAGGETAALLDQTEYTQPALFAFEVALYRQWEAWGLAPDLVVGHSIGELVAAHVAGVLSLADAADLVVARARLMQRAKPGGAMVSVVARDADVAELLFGLEDRVSLAAVNGPDQLVLSGDAQAVETIAAKLAASGKRVHRLRVSHAFHSPHMDGILEELHEVAQRVTYRAPRIGVVCNLTGTVAPERITTAEYWVRQVRGAVRFRDAIRTAEALGADRYVECGPRGVLAAMAAECTSVGMFVASQRDGRDEPLELADAIGRAHVAGVKLRWDDVFAETGARRVELPTYAFQGRRYWLDRAARADVDLDDLGVARADHELLGAELELPDGGRVIAASIGTARAPWLADHRVLGATIVPGMALVDMTIGAGARIGRPRIAEMSFEAPLVVADEPVHVQWRLEPDGAFRIDARDAKTWTRIASGRLAPAGELRDVPAPPSAPKPIDGSAADPIAIEDLYERLAARGLAYGPAFRGLRDARRAGDVVTARLALPAMRDAGTIHATLLDACLHAVLAAEPAGAPLRVPFELADVQLAPGSGAAHELSVRVALAGNGDATLAIRDATGALVGSVGRINFRSVSADKLARATRADAHGGELYRLEWTPARAPATKPGRCAVVGSGALANEVAAALRDAGAHVVRFDHARELVPALRRLETPVGTVVRVVDGRELGADAALAETTHLLGELQGWLADRHDARYVLVTARAVAARDDDAVSLAHAPLWGLARSVRVENPDRAWLLVDTDATDASYDALGAAMFATDQPEVALRGGERLVPRLAAVPATASIAPLDLSDGTTLVTGGTHGLGAEVARHVVRRHGAKHLVLLSRRGGNDELVRELAALGATATCATCDVADRAALARVVAGIDKIAAVFHCAAIADDALAATLAPEHVARAFAPKLDGARHLHELTLDRAPAVFALFSSIAGITGNEGQAAYAAANSFLDGLAATRRRHGLPGWSLAWGTWSEIGMAARLDERARARFHELGLAPLAPHAALDLMDRAFAQRAPIVAPLRVDAATIGGKTARALARLVAIAREPAHVDPKQALRDRLDAASLAALVRGEIVAVLKLPSADAIRDDRRLDELGMDSLMAVDIRRRLESRLGLQLPAALVFNHPTCAALVAHLLEVIGRTS